MAVLCATILATSNSQYVEHINKGPGLLFDPVGTLRIINDQFHIVIPVDVHSIQHHVKNINEIFRIIRFQCRENSDIDYSQCDNALRPLQAFYDDILRDFNSISHIISNGVSKRSAWFSGVGTVFKHIFGTMDEDDAESYNKAIEALYNNDKILADSITKSVMVSKSAISNVNKSLHELYTNQMKLNGVLGHLSSSVSNVSETLKRISFKTNLSNIMNTLLSSLLTISFKVEDLLNSILFVKSNTLHPSILSPKQMYNDISNNLKIIPKYRDFPVSLHLSNIHTLINIADLVCYYLDDKLMFIVKLPLVSLLEYNIYRNLPLPTPYSQNKPDSFAMILPPKEFLILSKDKSSYTYLRDLNKCKTIPTETYLCDIVDIYIVSDNPSCEIEIITKALTSIPKDCQYKLISGNLDIWHKLFNNKWIFVQTYPTKLSIECNNKLSEYTISGTGVLYIPNKCIAYYKNLKLVTKNYPSINVPELSSELNIINDSCCSLTEFQKFKINLTSLNMKTLNLDNLKNSQIESEHIIQNLKTLKNPNTLNNHISIPILSILSIIICLVILIIIICKRAKLSRKIIIANPKDSEDVNSPQPQLRID